MALCIADRLVVIDHWRCQNLAVHKQIKAVMEQFRPRARLRCNPPAAILSTTLLLLFAAISGRQ